MSDTIRGISAAVFSVNFVTVKDVEKFVEIASNCPKGTEIVVKHGNFTVDGKSLIGILSLNLSEPVEVEIKSNENSEAMSNLLNQFDKWRVEE